MAQFQITKTSNIEDAFIIKGILLEGQIRKGMVIHVSLNNSLQVTGSIVEIKRTHDLYSLHIDCSDQEEIELWEMLNLNGEIINIC